jgi:hypothetical protein
VETVVFMIKKRGRTYGKLPKVLTKRKERGNMEKQAGGSTKGKVNSKAGAL